MNKQKLNGALSHIHASGDLKKEVLMMKSKSKTDFRQLARRLAVCAAALALLIGTVFLWPASEENYITAPGVLVVRAYEAEAPTLSEEYSKVLEEGIILPPEYTWNNSISLVCPATLGLPLTFSISEDVYLNMEITFEILVSGGDFESQDYLSKYIDYFLGLDDSVDSYDIFKVRYFGGHSTISNNKTIYWRDMGHVFDDADREMHYVELELEQVFVDVIVRADDYIVGYAVIEIRNVEEFTYSTRMIKSASFPKVDGNYQKVSEGFVKEQMERIHDNA